MSRLLAFPGVDITAQAAELQRQTITDAALRMVRSGAGLEFFRILMTTGGLIVGESRPFLDAYCEAAWGANYADCLEAYTDMMMRDNR